MTYELEQLPYNYSDLEPYIDAQTMEIHHSKHHQTYITKLNKALEKHPELFEKPLEELLQNLQNIPEDIRYAVRNNGGGHYNHSLFWKMLSPTSQECNGLVKEKIDETFGSFDEFKEKFTQVATNRFGSGWAWLVLNEEKELEILATPNQDTPISQQKVPLLGIDVWEHAYYLKYQNKRPDYIAAFFSVINWDFVNEQLENAQ
ncbi:MAG: superoxide dismutase [Candidatus Woesearchaeota archaeon]